jgi:hypothetical protein
MHRTFMDDLHWGAGDQRKRQPGIPAVSIFQYKTNRKILALSAASLRAKASRRL